jgi:hypothetical protein
MLRCLREAERSQARSLELNLKVPVRDERKKQKIEVKS